MTGRRPSASTPAGLSSTSSCPTAPRASGTPATAGAPRRTAGAPRDSCVPSDRDRPGGGTVQREGPGSKRRGREETEVVPTQGKGGEGIGGPVPGPRTERFGLREPWEGASSSSPPCLPVSTGQTGSCRVCGPTPCAQRGLPRTYRLKGCVSDKPVRGGTRQRGQGNPCLRTVGRWGPWRSGWKGPDRTQEVDSLPGPQTQGKEVLTSS